MIELTLSNIQELMGTLGIQMDLEPNTNQLQAIKKFGQFEYPVFARIYEDSRMLQLLIFIPCNIKKGSESDTARLLHLINKEMDIPGFGMDENSSVLFYRVMLVARSRKIDKELVGIFIKSLENICLSFTVPIISVAQGKVSYEDVVKQLKTLKA
jgi:hypothetical protein